jgi:hypothetical protein
MIQKTILGSVPLPTFDKPYLIRWSLSVMRQNAARKTSVRKKMPFKSKRNKRLNDIIGLGDSGARLRLAPLLSRQQ